MCERSHDVAFATQETWHRLLAAAEALLEARANQMVTTLEWQALRQAVIGCDPLAAGRLSESEGAAVEEGGGASG